MKDQRVFGPVPSRRLGLSLGVSPIPAKACNYSCIYCQLGRTDRMMNTPEVFFDVDEIVKEFEEKLATDCDFDAVTIVGEGEPTLYSRLGDLILAIKERTDRPVAVITNGALLSDEAVRNALMHADIVLPSFDAGDEETFEKINRPMKSIQYQEVVEGLRQFADEYQGELWIETMLVRGVNDTDEELEKLKLQLQEIHYDRLYINVPVRPPAEKEVMEPLKERLEIAVAFLGGISIDALVSEGFYSEDPDPVKAICNIINRHPMNQHEITNFLESRSCEDVEAVFAALEVDPKIEAVEYKGLITYRIRK